MRKKHTYEFVKGYIESRGYKLISKKYHDANSKIIVKCPNCNHEPYEVTFSSFKNNGARCRKCRSDKARERYAFSFDFVKNDIESVGYELLSTRYVNQKGKLLIKCPKHGVFEMTYGHFRSGERCPKCGFERRGLAKRGCYHPLWKGGHDNMKKFLRDSIKAWKIRQFTRAGRKCEITGKRGELEVHHMFPFSMIVEKTFEDIGLPMLDSPSDYTDSQLQLIEKTFKDYNERLAHPVVMLKEIHRKFHAFCGGTTKPTSFVQLEEFKKTLAS